MYSFPLEEQELILKKGMASFSCDNNVFNGALYLTTERIVFVGYLLDINNKYMYEVPLTHVSALVPEKTFFVLPNVIKVTTIKGQTIKLVVSKRDQWLAAIEAQIAKIG